MATNFTPVTMNRQKAAVYQQTLSKESSLYQKINTILSTYQSGIHIADNALKVNATVQPLLGGLLFSAIFEAMKKTNPNPGAQASVHTAAKHIFQEVTKHPPSEDPAQNLKTLEIFQNKLDQLQSDQKHEFQKLLEEINTLFQAAVKTEKEIVVNGLLTTIKATLDEDMKKYQELYKQLETIPTSPSVTQTQTHVRIGGSIKQSGTGVLAIASNMSVGGNFKTGSMTKP